jgi:hypothetical protein
MAVAALGAAPPAPAHWLCLQLYAPASLAARALLPSGAAAPLGLRFLAAAAAAAAACSAATWHAASWAAPGRSRRKAAWLAGFTVTEVKHAMRLGWFSNLSGAGRQSRQAVGHARGRGLKAQAAAGAAAALNPRGCCACAPEGWAHAPLLHTLAEFFLRQEKGHGQANDCDWQLEGWNGPRRAPGRRRLQVRAPAAGGERRRAWSRRSPA